MSALKFAHFPTVSFVPFQVPVTQVLFPCRWHVLTYCCSHALLQCHHLTNSAWLLSRFHCIIHDLPKCQDTVNKMTIMTSSFSRYLLNISSQLISRVKCTCWWLSGTREVAFVRRLPFNLTVGCSDQEAQWELLKHMASGATQSEWACNRQSCNFRSLNCNIHMLMGLKSKLCSDSCFLRPHIKKNFIWTLAK